MRAYLFLENCTQEYTVDCITMTNKKNEEILDLSFCEAQTGLSDKENIIYLKNEECATFGLPKSLEDCFGNNKETYNFIKDCELASIVLDPFHDTNYVDSNIKPSYLVLYIANDKIIYSEEDLKDISIEFTS